MAKDKNPAPETPAVTEPFPTATAEPAAALPVPAEEPAHKSNHGVAVIIITGIVAVLLLGGSFCAGVFVGRHTAGFAGPGSRWMRGRGGFTRQMPPGFQGGQGGLRGRRGFGGPNAYPGTLPQGAPSGNATAPAGF